MFESLSDKLQGVFENLATRGRLSERDVNAALREVRLALLEADVNYKVVREFVGRIKERAIGLEVMESLTPAQQVVKIVNEELVWSASAPACRSPACELDAPRHCPRAHHARPAKAAKASGGSTSGSG